MSGPVEAIVVTLDAASESRAAIDTAVRLAARTNAPLHGIFVEDQELLELAMLPFARQITIGAGAEPFINEDLELHLRAQAERARRELLAAARRHGVTCTFEVKRGTLGTEAAYASERHIVVAGATSRPVAGHFRVEHRWWLSIEAAAGPLLIARTLWAEPGSIVILLRDRDAASARLLEAAAQVAAARDRVLVVMCPPDVGSADGIEKWIAERIAGYAIRMQIEVMPIEPASLHERLGHFECRLLALRAGQAGAGGEELRKLAERFACDMLIVS
jgi:nucleotide-binding universal stress UspA family protein